MTATLTLDKVSKTYVDARGERVEALTDISMQVDSGDFVSIIGPSGCGKSTLLYMIAGFLEPTSGRIRLDDHVVSRPGPDRAIVFQEYSLFPWMSALDNVTYGLRELGMRRAERRRRGGELLELVGLAHAADLYPKQLSGGMKQRLAIARTLAVDPTILLMDEPLGALDAMTRSTLQDEVYRIWEQARKSVVLVTHSVEEAIFLSSRIVVLSRGPGRVLEEVPVDLPHPRDRERILADPEYSRLHARIWELLGHTEAEARDTPQPSRGG